jgi:nucleoside diphosphate kinase
MPSKKREARALAHIIDKEFTVTHYEQFKQEVKNIMFEGEEFELLARAIYDKRSLPQNNYFHGVIIDKYLQGIEESDGRPLGEEVVNQITGEVLYIPLTRIEQVKAAKRKLCALFNRNEDGSIRGTSENDTVQQSNLEEHCREYIKFVFNIDVSLPGENLRIDKF